MRQLTLVETGRLEWWDVTAPSVDGADAALVRPLAVSRCDIDLPYLTGFLPPPRPFAIGHECVGEVVEVGDGVRGVRPGERVIVPFQISCGRCARCQRGHTGSCTAVPFLSSYGMPLQEREWGGALSDLIRVPFADAMLVAAPAGVPAWSLAAAADNATDGWRCVAPHLRARPGATVLVVGGLAPSVGLYAVDAALALGAGRVDVVSQNSEFSRIASELGANAIEQPFATLRGNWEITVDAAADPDGLQAALRCTDVEGVCVSATYYPGREVGVPMGRMYSKGVTLHAGRCHARTDLPEVAAAIAAGRLHPEKITTRRVAWDEALEALAVPTAKLVVERDA